MFLFLIASGLSLVFGVMRVLNFAHGSFYMLGAYLAWQGVQWLTPLRGELLAGGAARSAGRRRCSAAWSRRLLLRHMYGQEELYQLLLTYALVLILGDCRQGDLGHPAALGVAPADPRRRHRDTRHHAAGLQPVHHAERRG